MEYQTVGTLLAGRTLVVTGATAGIGHQAALSYASQGAKLLLIGRDKTKLRQLKQEIATLNAPAAEYYQLDLATATSGSYQQLAADIAAQHAQLDGLLHSAGVLGKIMPLTETPATLWTDVMKVNVDASLYLSQALLPLLCKADDASLIFTSSSVGRQGRAGWGAYAVSKFATEGMMQVLAAEYQQSSVRINCINPGGTRTAMRASAFPNEDPLTLKTAAEIMPLYLWLMGPDSRGVNGKSFDAQPERQSNATN